MNKICIVIPAYNEHKNIIKLIKAIKKKVDCYIVVVDDSENLKTKVLFNKIKNKKILYFHRNKKLGRGSAVIYGFKKIIKKKFINCFIEMDADFSHTPKELKRNVNFFYNKKLDLLIGSRYLAKSKIINWPLSRIILSKLSNLLARFLLGVPVNDYTNGYRFYSKSAIKTVISKCNKMGGEFIILSEIILVLFKQKYKISEIESVFKNRVRGKSSVNFVLVFQSLIGLIKLYLLKISNKI